MNYKKALITLVAILVAGAGIYLYVQNKQSNQPVVTAETYTNSQYGFSFSLPESWKGFTLLDSWWFGSDPSGCEGGDCTVTRGPEIYIRHPLFTQTTPRQDIPIMVFTLPQWADMKKGQFNTSAAPIGPSELGRNAKYVFALPARYNYAFSIGYEEVDQILKGNPLQAF